MKLDAQTPSSSRPSAGATAVPVAKTPMAEAPVAETPMAEAPVAEAAVVETSAMEAPTEETPGVEAPVAPSFPPAPMETGGAGDGQSWAKQVEAGEEESFQRSRPAKQHPHSQSRRHEPKSQLPFPLQDSEGRFACSCTTSHPTQCSRLGNYALAPQPAATEGHEPWEPDYLHDCRIPLNHECLTVEPPPHNPA